MRLALALLACALLAGCDHLYGGFDGGKAADRRGLPTTSLTADIRE